ncbi:MAG: hypothetical protein R3308_07935, partial [Thiohalobacterales bacterium]|nr:hypothetical protein [Thiohalobacterales bacterium]
MKMFTKSKSGGNGSTKMLSFIMLCAFSAMVLTFVQVGQQADKDRAWLADVSEQLVLSQQIAKYALAASTGDTYAFDQMGRSKDRFGAILAGQMKEFGSGRETPLNVAVINLGNQWHGFSNNIDAVLEGQVLIMAMAESTSLMSEVMPQLM